MLLNRQMEGGEICAPIVSWSFMTPAAGQSVQVWLPATIPAPNEQSDKAADNDAEDRQTEAQCERDLPDVRDGKRCFVLI